jgi:hypothetical protein
VQTREELDELRRKLLAQAFLYDHPEAYSSGVEAALHAVRRLPAAELREPSAPRASSRR